MRSSEKQLWELPPGFIYLVKGTLAQVHWELRKEKDVEYLFQPSSQRIVDLAFSSFLDESQTTVIIPRDYNLPDIKSVDPDTRIFIVLVFSSGEMHSKAEKLYKSKRTKVFVPVSILNRNLSNNTDMQMALSKIPEETDRKRLLKQYRIFPQTLIQKLESGLELEELETTEQKVRKALQFLDSLLEDSWYEVWRSIPDQDLWKFFWIPSDPRQSAMFRFLTGLNNTKEHRGYCPELWPFLEMHVRNPANTQELRYNVLKFASWVRACSTCFSTKHYPGLRKYKSRNSSFTGYEFRPSLHAIRILLRGNPNLL